MCKVRKVLGTICIMPLILFLVWCIGSILAQASIHLIPIGVSIFSVIGIFLLGWGE